MAAFPNYQVISGGAAAKSGKLRAGDRILSVSTYVIEWYVLLVAYYVYTCTCIEVQLHVHMWYVLLVAYYVYTCTCIEVQLHVHM